MFGTTPDFDVRKRYALSLLQQGMDSSPVKHPLAAVARALQGGIGGYLAGQAQQEDAASGAQMFNSLPGLGGSPMPQVAPQASAPVMPQNGVSNSGQPAFGDAIAKIESGGRYDALGPVTKTGDRAYGKYQVMGANIPQWTQTALGQPMTAQQFLASPEAQDAVFQKQFGGYVSKYGPEGAAKAWFAGERGMNNPNARDQLGTTVDSYAKKITGALGPQVASISTGTPQNVPQQPQQQVAQATPRQQVQIPPEVAQTIRQLGADPRTRAQAWQLYLQYAKPTEQWIRESDPKTGSVYQRNVVTGETKVIEKSDVLPEEAMTQKERLAKAGKPETTINNTVNPVLKGVGDRFNERMDQAQGSVTQIQAIHEARKALDGGAFTGMAAEPKLFFGKAAALFDIPSDRAVNTEVLRSAIGDQVLAKAKTLGANPSNADRDYIEKVVGGKIALEEGTMRRLLDMQENWARAAIKRANADGERLLKAQPDELKSVAPLMRVEEPMTYRDFIKTNPQAAPQAAPQQPAQTPQVQEGMTATNPQTGQKVIFKGGRWIPQ